MLPAAPLLPTTTKMRPSFESTAKQAAEKRMAESAEANSEKMSPGCCCEDACILDMDYFVKTVSTIKAKGVQPDLIGSMITHYASKWLPDLAGEPAAKKKPDNSRHNSPENPISSLMRKRLLVETLVTLLPPEAGSVPCGFLLRLLRIANFVGVEPMHRAEVEKRIGHQLDQASLEELLIPAFSHTSATLLDVGLVLRMVKRFVALQGGTKNTPPLAKVAKLTDCYLAEAAIDAGLTVQEFEAMAAALPNHARISDDGLYRAVDTYLKAHPGMTKSERKRMCKLIDSRKLSLDACLHAAQNERLPVRMVIQVLLCEQAKLNRRVSCSPSFNGLTFSPGHGLEAPSRCHSKRETTGICDGRILHSEIRSAKEELTKLQLEFLSMKKQIEKLAKKRSFFFFFPWRTSRREGVAGGGGGGGTRSRMDESSSSCGVGGGSDLEMYVNCSNGTPQKMNGVKSCKGLAAKGSKFRRSLS
ncbi:Root phototropism protein 3 [Nymphaea thermarum]|nr:Root phototropism protein 3 [Nymphaea thermarum]